MPNTTDDRIVLLIDMDCFYMQVEQRERPELWGKPCAVVQYNNWKGGGLIAVSYEARALGVKRGSMRGDDARAVCPSIELVQVPVCRDKADLTKYREASQEVFDVLNAYMPGDITVERASVDEAYLDVTKAVNVLMAKENKVDGDTLKNSHVLGDGHDDVEYDRENVLNNTLHRAQNDVQIKRLLYGAQFAETLRAQIYSATQFRCSAGIAWNKTLAKLVTAVHKPNAQSVLMKEYLSRLWEKTKIGSVRHFGGKMGASLKAAFGVETMANLSTVPYASLSKEYGIKHATWLRSLIAGDDAELVIERNLVKSIASSKNYTGQAALTTAKSVSEKLMPLCEDLVERYANDRLKNDRTARTLTAGLRSVDASIGGTRQATLLSLDAVSFHQQAIALIRTFNKATGKDGEGAWYPPVINLSVSVSNFEGDLAVANTKSIAEFMTVRRSQEARNNDDTLLDGLAELKEPPSKKSRTVSLATVAEETNLPSTSCLLPTSPTTPELIFAEHDETLIAPGDGSIGDQEDDGGLVCNLSQVDDDEVIAEDDENTSTSELFERLKAAELARQRRQLESPAVPTSTPSVSRATGRAKPKPPRPPPVVVDLNNPHYPIDPADIDRAVYDALPRGLQFEVKSYYKTMEMRRSGETAVVKSQPTATKKPKSVQKPPPKSRKMTDFIRK